MGKSLIINGADFSANGIAAPHVGIDWIGLSTTRTTYITSGLILKNRSKVILDFTTKAATLGDNDKGGYWGAITYNGQALALVFQKSGALRASVGAADNQAIYNPVNYGILDGNRHSLSFHGIEESDSKTAGITLDGVNVDWPSNAGNHLSAGQENNNSYFYLDCCNWFNTPSSDDNFTNIPDLVRIHRVKIYDDYRNESSLRMDAIPVRKADGTICYYDNVTNTYLVRNDGSTPANSTQS